MHYPRYLADTGDLKKQKVLRRFQIREMDRLGRGSRYPDSQIIKKAMFEHQLMPHLHTNKQTMVHIAHRLPEYKSVILFDEFVIDDVELRLYLHNLRTKHYKTRCQNPFCLS